jgi:hypothetical protein
VRGRGGAAAACSAVGRGGAAAGGAGAAAGRHPGPTGAAPGGGSRPSGPLGSPAPHAAVVAAAATNSPASAPTAMARPATSADSFAGCKGEGLQGDPPADSSRSGGGRRLAALARAALARGDGRDGSGRGLTPTPLQRLPHTRQLQVPVVLLGDIKLLRRAVRVADRQLIGLARGDVGLVEVRNVHRDRLGAHRDSFLGRSAIGKPMRRRFRSKIPRTRGAVQRNRCCRFSESVSGLFCHQRRRQGRPPGLCVACGGRAEEWLRTPDRAADRAFNFQAGKLGHQAAPPWCSSTRLGPDAVGAER